MIDWGGFPQINRELTNLNKNIDIIMPWNRFIKEDEL